MKVGSRVLVACSGPRNSASWPAPLMRCTHRDAHPWWPTPATLCILGADLGVEIPPEVPGTGPDTERDAAGSSGRNRD